MANPQALISAWEGAFRTGTRKQALERNTKLIEYYDYIARSQAEVSLRLNDTAKLAAKAWQEFGIGKNGTALDVGCGGGDAAIELSKHAKSVTAIDMSSGMIEMAKKRGSALGIDSIKYKEAMWEAYEPAMPFSMGFSAMCPAICTIEDILKLEASAEKGAAIVTVGNRSDTGIRNELRAYITDQPLPGMMAEGILLYNMLYSIKRSPNAIHMRHRSESRLLAQAAIERYCLYYKCYGFTDSATSSKVADFINANAKDGIWAESVDIEYIMVYWVPHHY
ncbi:MAG: methyltransferase domain-containing protein [Eubacteriaceae bacterium]|jgi:SAM-dependent methyltransferase|nr:methyltransferase domain-containing protein [Eubacteriaceae bacterium]